MSPVWTFVRLPPNKSEIKVLSDEAELVWQAIVEDHEQRMTASRQRLVHVGPAGNYYQNLYSRSFGLASASQWTSSAQLHRSQYTEKSVPSFTQNRYIQSADLIGPYHAVPSPVPQWVNAGKFTPMIASQTPSNQQAYCKNESPLSDLSNLSEETIVRLTTAEASGQDPIDKMQEIRYHQIDLADKACSPDAPYNNDTEVVNINQQTKDKCQVFTFKRSGGTFAQQTGEQNSPLVETDTPLADFFSDNNKPCPDSKQMKEVASGMPEAIPQYTGEDTVDSETPIFKTPETAELSKPVSTFSKRLSEMKRKSEENASMPASVFTLNTSKRKQGSPKVKSAKQLKKSKFVAPYKELPANQIPAQHKQPSNIKLEDVDTMNDGQRKLLKEHLKMASEVALTLVFVDGSSQLREMNNLPLGIAIAYPVHTEPSSNLNKISSLRFVIFNLNSFDKNSAAYKRAILMESPLVVSLNRTVLEELMLSKTHKLGFKLKDLLISLSQLQEKQILQSEKLFDLCVASWLLDPDHPPVFLTHITHKQKSIQMVVESDWKVQVCRDLSVLGPVMLNLYQELKSSQLWQLYTLLEMPLCPLLAAMDIRGIHVDRKTLLQFSDILKKKLNKKETEAHKLAGRPFLINSHAQLRQVLYDELKLDQKLTLGKRIARTNINNEKSTSEAVLNLLKDLHPLPKIILEYRQLSKLKSTYVEGMLGCLDGDVLHTHWDQTAAATGRLTSVAPNIQAIPKQPLTLLSEESISFPVQNEELATPQDTVINVRDAFVSRHGYSLLSADFAQIEFRLLAHLSGDPCILDIFNKPGVDDIFVELTAKWLKKQPTEVTQTDREQTKRVVYSIMYGVVPVTLLNLILNIIAHLSTVALKTLNFNTVMFPGVNEFTKKCISQAQTQGYQQTVFKRRRLCPNIKHGNPVLRSYAERQVVNFCIQGSAADICKAAMVQLESAIRAQDLDAKVLVQIHDELLLEVNDNCLQTTAELVKSKMEDKEAVCGGIKLNIPLKVSISTGKKWGSLTPFPLS